MGWGLRYRFIRGPRVAVMQPAEHWRPNDLSCSFDSSRDGRVAIGLLVRAVEALATTETQLRDRLGGLLKHYRRAAWRWDTSGALV